MDLVPSIGPLSFPALPRPLAGLVKLGGLDAPEAAGPSALSLLALSALLALAVWLVYAVASSRPLPGIPRNHSAARIVLGDLPDIVRAVLRGGDVRTWMADQTARLGSGIVQISPLGLFGRPWVVLSDYRQAQDLLRGPASGDFDVAGLHNDIFRGLTPEASITKYSADADFKRIRALTRDLMSPRFLSQVRPHAPTPCPSSRHPLTTLAGVRAQHLRRGRTPGRRARGQGGPGHGPSL
ncbi:hypothetical protein CDD83_2799 [Cordyceps sp. RAO-2017]|nr:hypothetical protein CDD83_2799 [Cordyceps sp. RAO-2017]